LTKNSNPAFYARRKDANHDRIANALRVVSYCAYDTHKQADGFPDILCIDPVTKIVVLFEVKIPGEALTPKEKLFFASYPGYIFVVYDEQEAIERMKECCQNKL
jgi:hypothetical protein